MLTYADLRHRGSIIERLKTATTEACESRALEACCAEALTQIEKMRELLRQYRDDMHHPPAPDSRQRRIAAINTVIGEN